MRGTPKQVEWAEKLRQDFLEDCEDELESLHIDPATKDKAAAFMDYVNEQSAAMWINSRKMKSNTLLDCLWEKFMEEEPR